MSSTRQLAAIMFTDIVGYTALMGKDEQKAFEVLKKNRHIHKLSLERCKGKLLKEIGDGMLTSFSTASDAVYCAIDILDQCKREANFQLRIGIHLGEVVFENHDVFGDGVNIASRIQSIADPGEILVSESVYRNIANKKGLLVEFLREENLKNVNTPIKIARVVTESNYEKRSTNIHSKNILGNRIVIIGSIVILAVGGYFLYPILLNKKTLVASKNMIPVEKKSLAVLPFKNLSNDKEQEFMSDGIAEEILNTLYNTMKDLKVPGRSSCFSFKNKVTDLVTIGKILNVKYILEGTIQKSGDNIGVRVFLNDAETGYQLKTWEYHKELREVISLQDEVAKDISEELKLTLFNDLPDESKPVNPQAYELVLKGNYYFNKGPEGLSDAVSYHQKAIALDSAYAYPHIRLGWTLYQLTLAGIYPSIAGFDRSKKELEKGLMLATSAQDKHSAHLGLAYIHLWKYNWKEAWAEHQKAAAINPKRNDFDAFYSCFAFSKTNEAVEIFKKVIEENPVDLLNLRDYALLQHLDHKQDDARKTCDKILELNPGFSEAYRLKGLAFLVEKNTDSAITCFQKASKLKNPWTPYYEIIALGYGGKKQEAQRQYDEMKLKGEIPAISNAVICHSLEKTGEAFQSLNTSFKQKDFWLVALRVDPIFDIMRPDREFGKIVKKMNFPG